MTYSASLSAKLISGLPKSSNNSVAIYFTNHPVGPPAKAEPKTFLRAALINLLLRNAISLSRMTVLISGP